jgi:hypothetical protein
MPAVTKLDTSLVNGRVQVQWEQPGSSSAKDYTMRVLREDGRVVPSPELQLLPGERTSGELALMGFRFLTEKQSLSLFSPHHHQAISCH